MKNSNRLTSSTCFSTESWASRRTTRVGLVWPAKRGGDGQAPAVSNVVRHSARGCGQLGAAQ